MPRNMEMSNDVERSGMMKKKVTNYIIIIGIVLFVVGFYAMFIKAGLPYQDPTPEMTRRWMLYYNAGKATMPIGIGLVLTSLILKFLNRLNKK